MNKKTFDELMKDLEQIVESLENGDVPLEKAVEKYKQGIDIIKVMNELLNDAKKQFKIVADIACRETEDDK